MFQLSGFYFKSHAIRAGIGCKGCSTWEVQKIGDRNVDLKNS